MIRNHLCTAVVASAMTFIAAQAEAATFYTEDFTAGTNGWRFATATTLTPVGSGGPDGSPYVSRTFDPTSAAPIIFRAQEEFPGIDFSYTGNWISLGVNEVSAWVRHSLPEAIEFTARFSNPANFPGASYVSSLVPSNTWTKVTFDVTASSPQNVTYEGTSHATVMSNVGHMQFGANIPSSLQSGPAVEYTFDFDGLEVLTIPEPASASLAALACSGLSLVVRRRRR